MQSFWRHGDVGILAVDQLPQDLTELIDLTLAHGEVTGHAHRITDGRVKFYLDEKTQRRFLQVATFGLLTHEEHGPIRLPAGLYEVKIQHEYSPAGWRQVAD